jgi:hypothetical protein
MLWGWTLWGELAKIFKLACNRVLYAFWRGDLDSAVEEWLRLQGAGLHISIRSRYTGEK